MTAKNLIKKGNVFEAQFQIDTNNENISPEYMLYDGAVVFQIRSDILRNKDRYIIFIKFIKSRSEDESDYQMLFTSPELEVSDKRLMTDEDDDTWHIIYEGKNIVQSFNVGIRVDPVPQTDKFATLYEDTDFTDFELRGVDGTVRVHRCALAAASPALRRMMVGPWREAQQGHVDVPDATATSLRHLKDYIYLGTLPETGLERLILISSCYLMPDLERQCVLRLAATVTAQNASDMIMFAAEHKVMRLLFLIYECMEGGVLKVTEMRDHHHANPAAPAVSD